jgi:hypothetical protein
VYWLELNKKISLANGSFSLYLEEQIDHKQFFKDKGV